MSEWSCLSAAIIIPWLVDQGADDTSRRCADQSAIQSIPRKTPQFASDLGTGLKGNKRPSFKEKVLVEGNMNA
jgi:hypothetical protein